MTTKQIGICLDDVGLLPGVGETALRLAALGRLSAASCITTHADWRSEGRAVATALAANPEVELGLHFNLSEGRPLSADLARHWPELPPLPLLIVKAFAGALPLAAIAVELQAQIDAFVDAARRAPTYVDGHQHVHHLRGVRDLVVAAATSAQLPGVAVRNTGAVGGPGSWPKRQAIERTGGRALLRRLEAAAVRHNAVLLGVYDFDDTDYRQHFRAWLDAAPPRGGLLHCHARAAAPAVGDVIAGARAREAAYLLGPFCDDDLAQAGFSVGAAW